MRRLVTLIREFHADERGVFAIIFAVMAIVLIAMGGAVVDYVSVQQGRTRTQVALDAAALALQPKIFVTGTTEEGLRKQAEDLLLERLRSESTWALCPSPDDEPCAQVYSATMNKVEGTLNLKARLKVPTNFVALVGVPKLEATLQAEATRKKLALEVAFVLDNSKSMEDEGRMTALIAATKCAANILLNDVVDANCNTTQTNTTVPNTRLAIIPFTMQVNVGTNYANAKWLDRTGATVDINNDNFDDDDNELTPFVAAFDRIKLFGEMKNAAGLPLAWGGCVEARRYPYDTNDTEPSVSKPNTLFTPLFAPDERDGMNNSYLSDTPNWCKKAPTCVLKQTKTKAKSKVASLSAYNNASNFNANPVTTTLSVDFTDENGVLTHPASCPASAYNNAGMSTEVFSYAGSSAPYVVTMEQTWAYPFTNRELQERLCKYKGAVVPNTAIVQASVKGPNADCPVNPIVPLTDDKPTITAAIGKLAPQGGTNIHIGSIWGLHTLTPTEPFTEGATSLANTSKYLVIMTDGDNTAYQANNLNGSSFYSAYGYPYNERLGNMTWTNAQLQTEMNKRTVETCNSAKALGITVYTIGFKSKVASSKQMLTDCASDSTKVKFPDTTADLILVFKQIANEMATLRLAK